MPRFAELKVWQAAHALSLAVYRVTKGFPRDEAYGLTQQVRRAVVSVEANLAEGQRRRTRKDFRQFVAIAEGSLAEVQCCLLVALDLQYLSATDHSDLDAQALEIEEMLAGLYRSLDEKQP